MATINKDRPYLAGGQYAPAAIKQLVPIAASQTPVAGDLLFINAGTSAAAKKFSGGAGRGGTSLILGINEFTYGTAPTVGTLVPITLALPGYFYLASVTGAITTGQANFNPSAGVSNASVGWLVSATPITTFTTVATQSTNIVAGFASYAGRFTAYAFNAQGGTSLTAGQVYNPNAGLGVSGDTNPRVYITFQSSACAFGR